MQVRKWGCFDGMEPPLGPALWHQLCDTNFMALTSSKFIIIIIIIIIIIGAENDRNESFLLISHNCILILAYSMQFPFKCYIK
jgi:hypothetical protein